MDILVRPDCGPGAGPGYSISAPSLDLLALFRYFFKIRPDWYQDLHPHCLGSYYTVK